MNNLPNVLIFRANKVPENTQLDSLFATWLRNTRSKLLFDNDLLYSAPISRIDAKYRAGSKYHVWVDNCYITHVEGFEFANHYIKMPISFIDIVAVEETIEEIDGETFVTPEILNSKIYKQGLRTNKTDCLVKFSDANYSTLIELIDNNIVAEDKFFDAIGVNKDGVKGEFYVEYDIEETI